MEDRWERQPVADAAGRVIAFDGYLFDRQDLCREHGFDPGLADSAMAVAWLDRFGAESLTRLRGDFTLACWDPRQACLSLYVAPMVRRLIYWHATQGGFWFANTMAGLQRFRGVPRQLDPTQLAVSMVGHLPDPGATIYRDIRLLAPGTLLTVNRAGPRERALWRLDPHRRIKLSSDGAYADAARELLDRAVQVRLRSAAPVASLLSAGLDSSAVTTSAARLLDPAVLRTYTAVPSPGATIQQHSGWYDDERAGVGVIAALYKNIQPSFYHSDGPEAFERDSTPLFLSSGRPFVLAHQVGWFDPIYRAVRRNGHSVLLTGQSGNFSFSYDGMAGFGEFARAGRIATLTRLLPPVARFLGTSPWSLVPRKVVLPALPVTIRGALWRLKHHGRRRLTYDAAIRPSFATKLGLADYILQSGETLTQFHGADSRAATVYFLERRAVKNIETIVAQRAYYGIDWRDPLFDAELSAFCLAIPREQYLIDGRNRSLARRVLAARRPDAITNTPLRGQQRPEWFARISAQRDAFAAELAQLEQVPLAAELLDLPRLKALIASWPINDAAAKARRLDYNLVLPRAVHMGRFLRWHEGANR